MYLSVRICDLAVNRSLKDASIRFLAKSGDFPLHQMRRGPEHKGSGKAKNRRGDLMRRKLRLFQPIEK
jgi:hypothetical protein